MAAEDGAEFTRASELKHGQVCYLQIPAVDLVGSADFYEKVFGWRIRAGRFPVSRHQA